jgi:rod shape-determining protein MreD
MQDLWAGRMIGLDALTFALLGYAIASIQQKIVHDPIFVPGLIAGLSQVVVTPFQWLILYAFGYHFSWLVFSRPLPVWILFSMLFTPALGGILGFHTRKSRHSDYHSLSS